MALPRKYRRPKAKMPGRISREHRRWVKSHACCVPGCRRGPIVFAHVRAGIPHGLPRGGMALKSGDALGISLCHEHHMQQHDKGEITFATTHRIDLVALALEFAARSPALKGADIPILNEAA